MSTQFLLLETMNVSSNIFSSGRQKLDLRKRITPKTFSLSALTSQTNIVFLKILKVHTCFLSMPCLKYVCQV